MRIHIVMLLLFAQISMAAVADEWPAWRGADGSGISKEKGLPVRWSATDNVLWKVPLAEPCNSTPVVWGDRVFITQGLDSGRRRALIATNSLNEPTYAAPAAAHGQLFLRSHKHLYCIGENGR